MLETDKNITTYETHPLFPSGEWEGFYTYAFGPDADRHKMSFQLDFKKNLISGSGSDDIGGFSFKGTYDTKIMKCSMSKHYAAHTVLYEGSVDENGIWGTWTLEWGRGGFHIWPKPGAEKKVDEIEFSLPEKIQIKVVVIKVNK